MTIILYLGCVNSIPEGEGMYRPFDFLQIYFAIPSIP